MKIYMNRIHKRRLLAIVALLLSSAIAVALILYALRQNLNVFYSPSEVLRGEAPIDRTFRLGGLVLKESVQHSDNDVTVHFIVTDQVNQIKVRYRGVLPDLFREGQGIISQGRLQQSGLFIADQVLAKHDANYMPPQVQHALETAG